MSLRRNKDIFKTVTFRLTVWYAAVFTLLSITGFTLVYYHLERSLLESVDRKLDEDIHELETNYFRGNLESLQKVFALEAEDDGKQRVFIRLVTPHGKLLASSDLGPWQQLNAVPDLSGLSNDNDVVFKTLHPPGHRYSVRTAVKKTQYDNVLQIGRTNRDNDELMETFRNIFGLVYVLMFILSIAVGLLMARKAMSGVENITRAASRIGNKNLNQRVAVKNEGQEIISLAAAFNGMLDRIEALITELKEVSDNVAHDLRSPITRIQGIAETTMSGEQNIHAYREMACTVIEESHRLVEMINTMLEISRTNSGVAGFSIASVDLQKVVDDAVDIFRPVAEDMGILLEIKASSAHPVIQGDRTKLQRVIANLLDNAIKFTPANGKVILSTSVAASNAIVTVADTGAGIDEKDIHHIFDRFYRGEKSRSTQGNGLGLCLALSLTRAHGGDIAVKSTPGEGSAFTVSLPISPSTR